MTMANKHGLSRDIPLPVQREIRQNSGFGCVICGCAIYQYEHIDPPFAEATEHNASKMALLCGACHDRATRGLLSKDTIKKALAQPKCLQTGFSFAPFDIGNETVEIFLGATKWVDPKIVLEINNTPLLIVESPEVKGGPFRISASFFDRNDSEIFRILRNEWQGPIANWDIELQGTTITIRCSPRDVILKLRCEPPSRIFVERLEMYYQRSKIICEGSNDLLIMSPDNSIIRFAGQKYCGIGCDVGISITPSGVGLGKGCKSGRVSDSW